MNLSPRSVPVRVLENGGRVVFFAAVGIVTSSGGDLPPLPVIAGIVLLAAGLVTVWQTAYVRRFSYEVTEDTFDIASGVLSRREREIPYERVQNVDISENVLQRLLGLAQLRIETAGGSGTEAQLRYVTRAEAGRLQELLGERKRRTAGEVDSTAEDDATGTAVETETLFTLSDRELGILGVVSADLRLLGLASVLLSGFAPQIAAQLQPGPDLVSLAGPVLALLGLLGLWALSAITAVFRFYGFELRRRADELRYERGLLQRYSGTIPVDKVQTLRLRENVLARALGYAGLVIETAGYGPGQDGGAQSAVPLAKRERALALAREVEPVGAVEFERPPRRARTRYAARYGLAVAGLTAGVWAVDALTGWLPLWYLAAGLLLAVPPAAHLAWRHRGYHVGEDYFVTRNGFWRRETVVVPYDRVQTVANSQSVFQRRRDLGTVRVDTASTGGFFGTAAAAVDIDGGLAEQLREQVHGRFRRAMQTG
ncbi:MAG: PH domain-containing protein [Haloarculaceae archaeon]